MKYTYINRDKENIIFDVDEEKSICRIDISRCSYIRFGEPELSEIEKKNNSDREKEITWLDLPGGPFLALGLDLLDFLLNGRRDHKNLHIDWLESDHRLIITKLTFNPGEIVLNYEKKPIKEKSKGVKKITTK